MLGFNHDARKRASATPENRDRSRWYGLRPGDTVAMEFGGRTTVGKVERLHGLDNNGCTIRIRRGRAFTEIKGVCEWCTVVKRVEDKG